MEIIKAVPADDYCITVCFDNSHSATLDMKKKLQTIRFSGLRNEQTFRAVQTDGKALQWPDGTSMSVNEIVELAAKQSDTLKTPVTRNK